MHVKGYFATRLQTWYAQLLHSDRGRVVVHPISCKSFMASEEKHGGDELGSHRWQWHAALLGTMPLDKESIEVKCNGTDRLSVGLLGSKKVSFGVCAGSQSAMCTSGDIKLHASGTKHVAEHSFAKAHVVRAMCVSAPRHLVNFKGNVSVFASCEPK